MSKERREKPEKHPSPQIDTDAQSTAKRGKNYFGYKGHIGTDVGSNLIRKRTFTSARPHDSQLKDELLSGDEQMVFGDSAYGTIAYKRKARKETKEQLPKQWIETLYGLTSTASCTIFLE